MSAELKARTYKFGLSIVLLTRDKVPEPWCRPLTQQLIRCATSVGANYRAACRARSKAEFIAKLGICEEEADECIYWLEILRDAEFLSGDQAIGLLDEADQLLSIIVSSIKTAKGR